MLQAHPDIPLAKKLHSAFPNVYKDPNHKPEMALALTDFECMCGFRTIGEIKQNLASYPELKDLLTTGGNFEINHIRRNTVTVLFCRSFVV